MFPKNTVEGTDRIEPDRSCCLCYGRAARDEKITGSAYADAVHIAVVADSRLLLEAFGQIAVIVPKTFGNGFQRAVRGKVPVNIEKDIVNGSQRSARCFLTEYEPRRERAAESVKECLGFENLRGVLCGKELLR